MTYMLTNKNTSTHWGRYKMATISQTKYIFFNDFFLNFKLYFIEVCSFGSNWKYIITDSNSGLVPNMQQAIVLFNSILTQFRLTHICVTRPQWGSAFLTWRIYSLHIEAVFDLMCVYKLLWRHNGHDGVSNHQPHDCLLNRLFRLFGSRSLVVH